MTEKTKFYWFIAFCFFLLILVVVLILLFVPQDTSRDEVYQRMQEKAKIATVNKMVAIFLDPSPLVKGERVDKTY